MAHNLSGKAVAILATDGFEQSELTEPRKALIGAGATVHVVAPKSDPITGWDKTDWGEKVEVDRTLDDVSVADYDALVLPGGQINPDKLRLEEKAVAFVHGFVGAGKPVAAICHGPWLLVVANVAWGRTVTSFPSIRTDLVNAGASWVDEEVVVDQGLVTSRKPSDLPAFCAKVIEEIAEGRHEGMRKSA
jgi:protease I